MLKDTPPYQMMMRARLLSESVAWFEAFSQRGDLRQQIVTWIQDDQLTKQGVDEDGDIIGFYSAYTEFLTNGEKQAGDPYTLKDTGAFYESMFVRVLRDSILIEADGQKDDDNLFEKYGEGIIGLTEPNMQNLIDELRIKYIDYARRILFKGR